MAGLHPFNYGNVVSTGENVLNSRYARDPNNPRNQLLAAQIDVQKAKAQNPQGLPTYAKQPFFVKMGNQVKAFQLSDQGGALEVQLPDNAMPAIKGTWKDMGGGMQLLDPYGRDPAATVGRINTDIPQPQLPEGDLGGGNAYIKKTPPPEQMPAFKAEQEQAKSKAKFEQDRLNVQPKMIGAADAAQKRTESLKGLVAQAKSQANAFTTGFMGAATKGVPGTPAHDLSQTLLTLQANAGFDRLQEMRNNSVTGGALGQVSERELGLLMAAYAALEQSQSKGQFLQNLDRFEKQVDQSWKRVKLAYRLDYGEDYKELDPEAEVGPEVDNDPLGIRQ